MTIAAVEGIPRHEPPPGRVDRLYAAISAGLKSDLSPAAQAELAEWLVLLKDLADDDVCRDNIDSAEIAVGKLLDGSVGVEFARRVREEIDRAAWASSRLWTRALMLGTGSPAVAQLGGALCAFLAAAVIFTLLFVFQVVVADRTAAALPFSLFCVAAAATVGSLVSIIIGLQENRIDNRRDLVLSFVFGMFRPVIGVGFAVFLFLIVKSGYVVITGFNTPGVKPVDFLFLMSAIAFVCGFSERLGRDIAARVEGKIKAAGEAKAKP